MTTYVLKHTQCPKCAKIGKDTSHDNLAIYSDGGTYCFACGASQAGSRIEAFKNKHIQSSLQIPQTPEICLPEDIESTIPRRAIAWIESYDLSLNDLVVNRVVWSESYERLIFPYFVEGVLCAWQGRYFGLDKTKAKWYSRGKLHDFVYVVGDVNQNKCCFVEDVVSAIKLSRYLPTIPIFGSVIGRKTWERVSKFYEHAAIWLDPDMKLRMLKEARLGSQFGLTTSVIFTDKDPKELPHDQIRKELSIDKP